jgi:hypothetical protein
MNPKHTQSPKDYGYEESQISAFPYNMKILNPFIYIYRAQFIFWWSKKQVNVEAVIRHVLQTISNVLPAKN